MTSRNTIDTNILKIRDVFAFNPATNDIIQNGQLPRIGEKGRLEWYSTTNYFSTMSVANTTGTVLDLLQGIQPGLSTLSTSIATSIASTIGGLSSFGYVTRDELDNLSATPYGYISTTTLYQIIGSLGKLRNIINIGPMNQIGSNYNNTTAGYVSTVTPGEFRFYTSSLNIEGSNIKNVGLNNAQNVSSAVFDLSGLKQHFYANGAINQSSELTIDVNLNERIIFTENITGDSYISTFLTTQGGGTILGNTINLKVTNGETTDIINQGTAKFKLGWQDLAQVVDKLELHHRISTVSNILSISLTTYIPESGGIFVTLDNLDKV